MRVRAAHTRVRSRVRANTLVEDGRCYYNTETNLIGRPFLKTRPSTSTPTLTSTEPTFGIRSKLSITTSNTTANRIRPSAHVGRFDADRRSTVDVDWSV